MIDVAAAPAIEIAGLSKRYGRDGQGTLGLLGTGLVGLAGLVRRRVRSS